MGKLVVTMWLTLDGKAAGPNGEMDWILGDNQLSDYELQVVSSSDALLFGRKTYDDFASYWPKVPNNSTSMEWEKEHSQNMSDRKKFVVSSSASNLTWSNSSAIPNLDIDIINKIKAQSNSYVLIYGSLSVVQQLTAAELIDEYQLLTHPVLLGAGKSLFDNINHRVELDLVTTQTFDSGIVLSTYSKSQGSS